MATLSPWVRRAQSATLPVADRTSEVAGGTCPACLQTFETAQARNLHYGRKHIERRSAER